MEYGRRRFTVPKASVYVIDGLNQCSWIVNLISYIRQCHPQSQSIVVSDAISEETGIALLRCGAKGLLTYADAAPQILRAVETVAGGGYWVPRALLDAFIHSLLEKPAQFNKTLFVEWGVSRREQQILGEVLQNRSNKEIACQFNISERTVKFHVSNLLAKAGVQRRSDLILLAVTQNSQTRAIQ